MKPWEKYQQANFQKPWEKYSTTQVLNQQTQSFNPLISALSILSQPPKEAFKGMPFPLGTLGQISPKAGAAILNTPYNILKIGQEITQRNPMVAGAYETPEAFSALGGASPVLPAIKYIGSLLTPKERRQTITELGSMTGAVLADVASYQALESQAAQLGQRLSKIKMSLHGDNWAIETAGRTRKIKEGFQKAISTIYDDIYNKKNLVYGVPSINEIEVPSEQAVRILQNNDIPEKLFTDINERVGNLDTVGKIRKAQDIIDDSIHSWDGTITKSGRYFNSNQTHINTWKQLKSLIRTEVEKFNPEVASKLKELDDFASSSIYPTINKLGKIVGIKGDPQTESLIKIFSGGIEKAGERETLAKAPARAAELKKYFNSKEFNEDMNNLINNTTKLVDDMKSFRTRETMKNFFNPADWLAKSISRRT